jgi:hypothetical protein
MNLDDLTIGEARKLAAMFNGADCAAPVATKPNDLIGQKVIVRAYRAGVHYGELVSVEGECVTLKNARRLWYWLVADKKGISLSDVAEHGLHKDSKVCAVVGTQIVIDACEIITTTATAQKSIEGANAYRP